MSFELYQRETAEKLSTMPLVERPDPGAFDGFMRGTGEAAMQTFAKAARAGSLAFAAPIVRLDDIVNETGINGTRLSDKYFKFHDETFGRAVEYWTPNAQEVGVAGQVVGQLLGTLPFVIASPATAVAAVGLSEMEDLAKAGVSPAKAIAAGGIQAAGLGLGIWLPILGQTGWQRIVVGGALANTGMGVATRAGSAAVLQGTEAGDKYKPFDGEALTLDALLGLAFGSLAHISTPARVQGSEAWGRIAEWAKNMDPADVDAVLALRGAQHMNVDSVPGAPKSPADIEAHVEKVRTAIDQLAQDKPVDVSDLPDPRVEADAKRFVQAAREAARLQKAAERAAKQEGIPDIQETEAPPARVSAEPPPPRGEGERPGGAEATDPVAREADAFVQKRGDLPVRVGESADGEPVVKPLKQYVDDARAQAKAVREDVKLLELAAACMLGVA